MPPGGTASTAFTAAMAAGYIIGNGVLTG